MSKLTEGRYALGALTLFSVWVFVVLPFLYMRPHYDTANNQTATNCSAEESKNHGFWEKSDCDPVAYFTLWLVGFTGVLAVSTIGLWGVTWNSSVKQSRDMKASIDIAERSLTDLEAPIVGVQIINAGIAWDKTKTNLTVGILQYSFVNYGRTPATLFEIFDDVNLVKLSEGYPKNVKAERGPPMPYGAFVPPGGETRPFTFDIVRRIIGLVTDQSMMKTGVLFFLGTARYGDIFGNLYTLGFCFVFDDVGNRFIEAGDSDYSYCRKERGAYTPPGANRPAPQPSSPPQTDDPDDGELAIS